MGGGSRLTSSSSRFQVRESGHRGLNRLLGSGKELRKSMPPGLKPTLILLHLRHELGRALERNTIIFGACEGARRH
jgi:hypothetical protein